MGLRTATIDKQHLCDHCGHPVDVVDRFRDYSTTRGPMAEHVVTRCGTCGQQDLVHLAAQDKTDRS